MPKSVTHYLNGPIHIFKWKQNVYKQNEMKQYLGGKGKDRVVLIKKLTNARVESGA
jgi:hypothetical protein